MLSKKKDTLHLKVAIEVGASTMRLAYVTAQNQDPQKQLTYKTIRWRNNSQSLLSEEGIQEFRSALQVLVSQEKLAHHSVRIVLNGDFCVTRVVRGLADNVRNELLELEERSQRYLSLGPGPKALAVSQHQVDARHHHALLSVTNRDILEALVDAAESTGLKVEAIEPSLVAISRLVGMLQYDADEPCAIMFFNEHGIEFGISYQGLLLLDYRPSGQQSSSDGVSTIVSQHWSRLQRYCAQHFHHSGEFELEHLYVGGKTEEVSKVLKGFQDNIRINARTLAVHKDLLPWSIEEEDLESRFALAVGACVSNEEMDTIQPGPNLLDFLHQQTPISLRPIIVQVGMPLAALLLVAVACLCLTFRVNQQCAALQSQIDQRQIKVTQALKHRTVIKRAMVHLDHLQRIDSQVIRPDWNRLIALIGQIMPEDVWLDKLDYEGPNNFTITGASYDEEGVYEFVQMLEQSPLASEATLEGTRPTRFQAGPATEFELRFKFDDMVNDVKKEGSNE